MPNLNSGIVDVGIALIYVFVLVSVLVSAVNELFAGLLKQRAKALHQGIGELLQSPALRDKLYDHALIKTLAPPNSSPTAWLLGLLGRSQAPAAPSAMAGPSYIPKEAFSSALIDLLGGTDVAAIVREVNEIIQAVKPGALTSPELAQEFGSIVKKATNAQVDPTVVAQLLTIANELKAGPVTDLPARLEPIGRALGLQLIEVMKAKAKDPATGNSNDLSEIVRLLATDAPASVEQVRKALEGWFDAGMERVAGWYKRWTQLWQFGIGLAIAATLNINIATIGLTLWTDVPLRNAMVDQAATLVKDKQSVIAPTNAGTSTGDFEITVTPPPFDQNNDRVDVGVLLHEPVQQDTTVALRIKDNNITLKDPLVVLKGSASGHVTGAVAGLPITVTVDASYPSDNPTQKASRSLTVPPDPATRIKQTRELLKGAMVPIGWSGVSGFDPKTIGWMIPGWLLTAIGASFGAPFWFDLLGRVVQLRSGGRKPEEVAKAAADATKRSSPAPG